MNKATGILIVIAAAIILIGLIAIAWFFGTYNSLVKSDEDVKAKWGNVQSAYQRRADLIPNLVETVKGYRDFEQETLTKITELRSQAGQTKIDVSQATSPEQLQAAETSMDSVLSRLLVIVENYPELKASENFLSLQDEIAGTENRIKVERDNYNSAVKDFNIKVRSFPSNFVADIYGFETESSFEAQPGSETAPKISFQ